MEYCTNLIYSVGGGIKYGAGKIPIPETCKNVAYESLELVKKTPIPSMETCKNGVNGTWNAVKNNPGTSACVVGGVVAGASVVGPIVAGVTNYVGFGAIGVKGGSYAAAWQSSIGYVKAGSLFSSLQSFGATGAVLSTSTKAVVGAASGAMVYLKSKL